MPGPYLYGPAMINGDPATHRNAVVSLPRLGHNALAWP
jgi:hypothetical protein